MAPRKAAKDQSKSKVNAASVSGSDDMSLDASQSQDIDTGLMQKMLEKHNKNLRARKKQRTDVIEAAHNARVEKHNNDIKASITKRDETIRAAYRPKLERLLELTRRKRELDSAIATRLNQIEEAFLKTAEKLEFAIDARCEGTTSAPRT